MVTVLIHLHNEDPVLCELEDLPAPTDLLITVKNPRKKDGKDVHYLEPNVTTVIWPTARITFIEVIPGAEEEEIISFVRE